MPANDPNPFESPGALGKANAETVKARFRLTKLFTVALLGVVVGSYMSAELLYVHHPTEDRVASEVVNNTIAGTLSAPLGMSFGLLATFRFFGEHGWLVLPGILMVVIGSTRFWRRGSWRYLLIVFIGFALWAHNNYLSFSALMSV
jgi:hypothetical protein